SRTGSWPNEPMRMLPPGIQRHPGRRHPSTESDAEGTHGLAEEFAGLLEADGDVEALGAVVGGLPQRGDAVVAATARLRRDLLDSEPADAPSLRLVGDVQPPDPTAELGDLMAGVPVRHHEAHHGVVIDDRPR